MNLNFFFNVLKVPLSKDHTGNPTSTRAKNDCFFNDGDSQKPYHTPATRSKRSRDQCQTMSWNLVKIMLHPKFERKRI